jgi:hypothetical protein
MQQLPPWVAALAPILTLVAAIHAVRTGRAGSWLWIIIVFPVLGPLIYFGGEVGPRMGPIEWVNPITWLLDKLSPLRVKARLQDAIDRSPSVANKLALARWHAAQGDHAVARDLIQGCLTGVYKDDPELRLELAGVLADGGQLGEARDLLEQNLKEAPFHEPQKRDQLRGRVAEALGDKAGALAILEKARQSGPIDEEARVRLAMLLEGEGDRARARELYTEVVRRMRTANNRYRKQQLPWLVLARKRLKEAA